MRDETSWSIQAGQVNEDMIGASIAAKDRVEWE